MALQLPDITTECFFIAPIGEENSLERKRSDGVLNYIIARAALEVGLTAVRADKISDPGQINLHVIDHLLHAPAAVADLTGMNPNVFYEMGVRHTARLPLVLIAEKGTVLPFDIVQMRTIYFDSTDLESAERCQKEIVSQLRRAINDGVIDSPIATSVDVSSMSRGSALERSMADVLNTVGDMIRLQRETINLSNAFNLESWEGLIRIPTLMLEDFVTNVEQIVKMSKAINDDANLSVLNSLSEKLGFFREVLAKDDLVSTLRHEQGRILAVRLRESRIRATEKEELAFVEYLEREELAKRNKKKK